MHLQRLEKKAQRHTLEAQISVIWKLVRSVMGTNLRRLCDLNCQIFLKINNTTLAMFGLYMVSKPLTRARFNKII